MGYEAQLTSKCLFVPTYLASDFDLQIRSDWPSFWCVIRVH